ncbi:MAG: rfbD, partial [Chitinophagaceae bacterium]|nr:rfbD [Chitinophagaceae bacterium]
TLDLTDHASLKEIFNRQNPQYFINAAAYTGVDKAETEKELAYAVNATAPGMIASLCNEYATRLIHISTDYVFNGNSQQPYSETGETDPVNYYGFTKLEGEKLVLKNCPQSIIIRTSWVYSSFGHNFVKTMLRLMKERSSISVVNDQFGAPTYAGDLAEAIVQIISKIENGQGEFGIYHYSNQGRISWYDFAKAIKGITGSTCEVNAIPTAAYPTPAKRPSFSLMNTEKIKRVFNLSIPNWEESLHSCLKTWNVANNSPDTSP